MQLQHKHFIYDGKNQWAYKKKEAIVVDRRFWLHCVNDFRIENASRKIPLQLGRNPGPDHSPIELGAGCHHHFEKILFKD